MPFSDTADFEDASRGLIGRLDPCVVRAADGRVVWDNGTYGFLAGEAPDSVNPSLWRQSTLVARDGLFEVVEGTSLPALALGSLDADSLGKAGIQVSGDAGVLARLAAVLDGGDPDFAIVTPE